MAFFSLFDEKMKTLSAQRTYPFLLLGGVKRTSWKSAFVIPGAFRWRRPNPTAVQASFKGTPSPAFYPQTMELGVLAAATVCIVWQPACIGSGAHSNNRWANEAPMSATST